MTGEREMRLLTKVTLISICKPHPQTAEALIKRGGNLKEGTGTARISIKT